LLAETASVLVLEAVVDPEPPGSVLD